MFPIFELRKNSSGETRADVLLAKKKKSATPQVLENFKSAVFKWASTNAQLRPFFYSLKPVIGDSRGLNQEQKLLSEMAGEVSKEGQSTIRDARIADAMFKILLGQRSSRNLLPDIPLHFWLHRELGDAKLKDYKLNSGRNLSLLTYTMPGPVTDKDLEIGSDVAMGFGQWHFPSFVESIRLLGAPMSPASGKFDTKPESPNFREKNDYWQFFSILDLLPFSYQYFIGLGLVFMAKKTAAVVTTSGSFQRFHPTVNGKGVNKRDFYFWQAFAPEMQVLKYTIDSPVLGTTFRQQVDHAFKSLEDYYDFSPHKSGVSVLQDPYLNGPVLNTALPLDQKFRKQFQSIDVNDIASLYALVSRDYSYDFDANVSRFVADKFERKYVEQLLPGMVDALSGVPVYSVGSLGTALNAEAVPLGFSLNFSGESDEVSRQKSQKDTV